MHSWLNFNGRFIKENTPIVTAGNRGLRYGDGLFETMRFENGDIKLKDLHYQRLTHGLATLKIKLPAFVTGAHLQQEILNLVEKNNIKGAARIRLMIFRGDGGLYEIDAPAEYTIQVWKLPEAKQEFNENGLVIGLYDKAMKSCDHLSNIKSNNYLPYAMAAIHAKENKWNDCALINTYGRICDASIANIFWVKNGNVFTPPLTEGCVAGVMRRYLLDNRTIKEQLCEVADLQQADEVFLTNAVAGIRWVQEFNGTFFKNNISRELYHSTIA
ncbi:MAG: aminotransferase class IV [Chitinophagaceae bacterium]|nr:aminotransferase class IV [Chitinophagaceae bacterium]